MCGGWWFETVQFFVLLNWMIANEQMYNHWPIASMLKLNCCKCIQAF